METTVKQLILGVWWTTLPSPKNDATSGPTAKLPERPRSILDNEFNDQSATARGPTTNVEIVINAVLAQAGKTTRESQYARKGGLFFAVFEFELEIPD